MKDKTNSEFLQRLNITPAKLITRADEGAMIELRPGVYLASADTWQAEQASWSEFDQSKAFDFDRAPYWIADDQGGEPMAIFHEDDEYLLPFGHRNRELTFFMIDDAATLSQCQAVEK